MKAKNKTELKKKIEKFKIIIFDLDDTIYKEKNYDLGALENVSKFLESKVNEKKSNIFKNLKSLRFKKKGNKLIFNKFLNSQKLNKREIKYLSEKSTEIFQSYRCKNLKNVSSLKKIIKYFYKKKLLFLVTNGNETRQKNKIHYLGINKYFKKIFILDGKKNKLKPSIKSVKYLIKEINKIGGENCVYVGDNLYIDKIFAKNLHIPFLHFEF